MYIDSEDKDVKNKLSCKLTISHKNIKQKGDCGFVLNLKTKRYAIKFNDQVFNICKASKITKDNASTCKAVTIEKLTKKKFKFFPLKDIVMRQFKKIAKRSVAANPGNNDKTIKKSFENKIKKNLGGLILQGSKTISRVKSVTLKRVDKSLRITIVFRRYWRQHNKENQIFKKVVKKKHVTILCVVSFKKELKSTCSFNKKNGTLSLTAGSSKVTMHVCRFNGKKDLMFADEKV